jgi:hypothetical protein
VRARDERAWVGGLGERGGFVCVDTGQAFARTPAHPRATKAPSPAPQKNSRRLRRAGRVGATANLRLIIDTEIAIYAEAEGDGLWAIWMAGRVGGVDLNEVWDLMCTILVYVYKVTN